MKKIVTGVIISLLSVNLFAVDNYTFLPKLSKKSERETIEQVLNSQTDFTVKKQEMLRHDTKIRTEQTLKEEQDRIEEVIYNFNVLERSLLGFEERFIVNKVKEQFMNKYLIEQTDLLEINKNLNEVIEVK